MSPWGAITTTQMCSGLPCPGSSGVSEQNLHSGNCALGVRTSFKLCALSTWSHTHPALADKACRHGSKHKASPGHVFWVLTFHNRGVGCPHSSALSRRWMQKSQYSEAAGLQPLSPLLRLSYSIHVIDKYAPLEKRMQGCNSNALEAEAGASRVPG